MSDEIAIQLKHVNKVYKMFDSPVAQLLDVLKLTRKKRYKEFQALKDISLEVKKGDRLGLIGRNGAGKTTLLKMITGNFRPSSGELTVNGRIQALMDMGIGFHPEFTGRENIEASLIYNGLSKKELQHAIDDVIDFVELDAFLDQPLRTYSLGMKSRLYFATATAIKPEILIIDEVLGAGDAYFSAKSADRMKKLTQSGCTLLLVSHSTSQIIQFCQKAVWIECGEKVKEGDAIEVIKAYELYSKKLEMESSKNIVQAGQSTVIQSKWLRQKLLDEVLTVDDGAITQPKLTESELSPEQAFQANVSRWPSQVEGLKISEVIAKNSDGIVTSRLDTGEAIDIEIEIMAEEAGQYDCTFVILLFTEEGRWVTRHCSKQYTFNFEKGEKQAITMHYDDLLIGNGKYFFSAAIYKTLDLHDLSTAQYYDLLSRSFEININGYYKDDSSLMYHPAAWNLTESVEDTPLKNQEAAVAIS